MGRKTAIPVDLKARRKIRDHTQEDLSELLGVSVYQVSNYESGRRNLPMAQACEIALLYGGLTVEYEGVKLELRPKVGGDVKLGESFTPVVGALIAGKEMRDFLEHTQKLAGYALATMLGKDHGTQYLADAVKEAQEAKEAAERFILGVKRVDHEAYKRGILMAQEAHKTAVKAS